MGISDLNKITGDYWISYNGKYVVLFGKSLLVFRTDGSLVFRRLDMPNVRKVLFLPGDCLLVDGGGNNYYLLSLKDGSDVWCCQQRRFESRAMRFALSSDNNFAFDFYIWKDNLRLVRIDLNLGHLEEYGVISKLRATKDIMCDDNDIPCLLQTQYDDGVDGQISKNAVLYQKPSNLNIDNSFCRKNQWEFCGKRIAMCFLGDTETILTNDLYVYNLKSREMYYLLENDAGVLLPNITPSRCYIDHSGKYIILMYTTANVVIDWKKRKLVARYSGQYTVGCLIEERFWISTQKGLQCKTFPLMEDISTQEQVLWKPCRI